MCMRVRRPVSYTHLIVAAGVFTVGLQTTGTVGACIEALKSSNDLARWGAAIGPFLMAVGTGAGEAAILSLIHI